MTNAVDSLNVENIVEQSRCATALASHAGIPKPLVPRFEECGGSPCYPLGCHRSHLPERVFFEKLVQVLVFGSAYERIADKSCSESTPRCRREEWIELGVMERFGEICLEAYDHLIGLELSEVAVDGCVTKA